MRRQKMRAAAVLFLAAGILCLFSACGPNSGEENAASLLSVREMAAVVLESQEGEADFPPLYAIASTEKRFSSLAENYLPGMRAEIQSGVICCPFGAEADEIVIFCMNDAASAKEAETAMEAYLEKRAAVFAGYAPEMAAMAAEGMVRVRGNYAALWVCPNPERAEESFAACFGEAPPKADLSLLLPLQDTSEGSGGDSSELPSEKEEPSENEEPDSGGDFSLFEPEISTGTYLHDAVLNAWQSGEVEGLDEFNRAILEGCRQVIERVIEDEMTPYRKELAIHDWMLLHGEYDPAELSTLPVGEPDPNNDNPFGFLFSRKGICLGYSSTFQLFMDLLEIECLTVEGSTRGGSHAWNLVCLDGEWYCVDVTWDDPYQSGTPVSAAVAHRYMNLTDDDFRRTNHQWEAEDYPEAKGSRYRWRETEEAGRE